MAHDWPGNIRELENAVERALILSKKQTVSFQELNVPADAVSLDQVMSLHIRKVLDLTGEGLVVTTVQPCCLGLILPPCGTG